MGPFLNQLRLPPLTPLSLSLFPSLLSVYLACFLAQSEGNLARATTEPIVKVVDIFVIHSTSLLD